MELPSVLVFVAPLLFFFLMANNNVASANCSNGTCKLLDSCESDGDCAAGLYCFSCPQGYPGSKCVRFTATPVFNLMLLDSCECDGDCAAGLYCFSCPQGYPGSKCVRFTATPVFNLMSGRLLSFFFFLMAINNVASACSNGTCKLLDSCESDGDCETGLYCFSCPQGYPGSKCVRFTATPIFNLMNNSLPFNKYSFLTTHNAFAIDDGTPRVAPTNQEDTVAQQLNNGVRALMLDTYDFEDTVWLCHSFGGKCYDLTKFAPAVDTLKEIEAFLSANPSEIVTIILEDYVQAPNGLTKVFTDAGLKKYWFPVTSMPKGGQDWPLVKDMVSNNQRLLVFGSVQSKEQSEGIAYQWNYMVENQYGDGGMKAGECPNRGESSPLNDTSKSLVLVNYFRTLPLKVLACGQNSGGLLNMTKTCYSESGNRWANFLAVNFYKRSEGGGTFQAVDLLNGERLCGCNDVHSCVPGGGSCTP